MPRILLYHELAYHDVSCVILAPSTMHGSVKNKKVKNDKMDAFNIATNLMVLCQEKVPVKLRISLL